jgi:hypothetical protein
MTKTVLQTLEKLETFVLLGAKPVIMNAFF